MTDEVQDKPKGEFPSKEHQFKPGVSGNPAGRPPGPSRATNFLRWLPLVYRDTKGATRPQPFGMDDESPLTVKEAIDLATVAAALSGNQVAAERIDTALFGKPAQLVGQDPENPFPSQLPPVEVSVHVVGSGSKNPGQSSND